MAAGHPPRFLAEGIVWPQHVRPATAVAEGEPPDDWPQFCKAFCITIKEGTRAQHLRLLFETYARAQPGAISREEARDVCLKHVHRSGRVEERPAKNAVCAQELVEDFDGVSREGFLDCVGFEELWRRHMRVYKQLKIDVWCLLQDLGRRDAAERAVMRRPRQEAGPGRSSTGRWPRIGNWRHLLSSSRASMAFAPRVAGRVYYVVGADSAAVWSSRLPDAHLRLSVTAPAPRRVNSRRRDN